MRSMTFASLALAALAACSDGPGEPGGDVEVVAIEAGVGNSCAQLEGGTLRCWGRTIGTTFTDESSTSPVAPAGDVAVASFALARGPFGGGLCAIAAADGSTWCWGMYATWDQYIGYPLQPFHLQDTVALTAIAAGDGHACGLDVDGAAYCWGGSIAGKRGHGAAPSSGEWGDLLVNRVSGGHEFTQLAASRVHTCGVTRERDAFCWGYAPKLGGADGDLTETAEACFWIAGPCAWSPLQVPGMSDVEDISASTTSTCVVRGNGAVWCWQQVGGATPAAGEPEPIVLPEDAAAVSAGEDFACALAESGRVYCWGDDGPWRGTDDAGEGPLPVETDVRFTSISAGREHACAVDRDGAAWCWGLNRYGELGNGTLTPSSAPVRVEF